MSKDELRSSHIITAYAELEGNISKNKINLTKEQ